MDTGDEVLKQLKRLREGRGLNADRLKASPAVLSALATSDPGEAYDVLVLLLGRMGESDRVRALKVDFGIDLEDCLGRQPTPKEQDFLGDRRSGFAAVVNRDVKTLSRWSNQCLGELRGQLLSDFFDGHIVIAAGVKEGRVVGIELKRYEKSDEHLLYGDAFSLTNPEPGPSPPVILYGFPRDWRPSSIRFAVAFLDELPERAWAIVASNILDVGLGHERTELTIEDGMTRCRIENPSRSQLYGLWWQL